MIINQALKNASQQVSPLDAEILLAFVLKKDKIFLYKNPNYKLTTNDQRQFARFVIRRIAGGPIAYITNQKEFYGLDFYVDKNVLIPRPETEILVEIMINEIAKRYTLNPKRLIVADIGTGSGCVAIAIAKEIRTMKYELRIIATDTSRGALEVAKINAKKHKVEKQIKFLQGDLLEPLKEKVDFIVANLPYVKKGSKVNKFEPKTALFAGKDGLDLIKKLLINAPKYLKPGGKIFLEISPEQKSVLLKFIKQNLPNAKHKFIKDLAKKDRVLKIKTCS